MVTDRDKRLLISDPQNPLNYIVPPHDSSIYNFGNVQPIIAEALPAWPPEYFIAYARTVGDSEALIIQSGEFGWLPFRTATNAAIYWNYRQGIFVDFLVGTAPFVMTGYIRGDDPNIREIYRVGINIPVLGYDDTVGVTQVGHVTGANLERLSGPWRFANGQNVAVGIFVPGLLVGAPTVVGDLLWRLTVYGIPDPENIYKQKDGWQ